ncbi:MAG: hypothetical protein E7262_05235 [Lachnospiraceae bacterium]|nr:hypothetical protein [Lachnospiraceae bacterium]
MSDFEKNTIKRENITAYIIFCVIFAVGSFVFYKKTDNVYWAIALFICSIVLLGFYSRILALEDEMATMPDEEEEEEEYEEEEEEEDDEEVRRSIFIKNLPAFKKEARAKYNETARHLGRNDNKLTDGIMDVWLVDGRIIAMLKWKQIEHELEDFEGEYADMIVEGMSGRNVEFEYGLERYKNMPKYGCDGVRHNVNDEEEAYDEDDNDTTVSNNGEDPELAQILEQLESQDDDDDIMPSYKNNKNTNLVAQIFEKLMEK